MNPIIVCKSQEEIHHFEFNPINPKILVGGGSNGQVVIWDLTEKYKELEECGHVSKKKSQNKESSALEVKFKT